MKTYYITKVTLNTPQMCFKVPIPERHEKWGYKIGLSLKALERTQQFLFFAGSTYASISESPPQGGVPVIDCSDLWDFYRKSGWDQQRRVFASLGDHW